MPEIKSQFQCLVIKLDAGVVEKVSLKLANGEVFQNSSGAAMETSEMEGFVRNKAQFAAVWVILNEAWEAQPSRQAFIKAAVAR
jgi:hypothetical protein